MTTNLKPADELLTVRGGMTRTEILAAADQAVSIDRAETYGAAENSFTSIGMIWDALDRARGDRPRTAADVGLYMAALKLVRASGNPGHLDSIMDAAGYCALSGEMASEGGEA